LEKKKNGSTWGVEKIPKGARKAIGPRRKRKLRGGTTAKWDGGSNNHGAPKTAAKKSRDKTGRVSQGAKEKRRPGLGEKSTNQLQE